MSTPAEGPDPAVEVSEVASPARADSAANAAGDGPAGSADGAADVATDSPAGSAPLRQLVEALLFVADEPVGADQLAAAALASQAEVTAELEALASGYDEDDRGFVLRHTGAGWRLYTHDACADAVERFLVEGRTARLSQAALETLAVVAYRQPVTRSRIASIRGVASDSALRNLVGRGLVEEIGVDESSGATLFGTTSYFLERLGLQSLTDLPSLAPLLPQLEDMTDD